ncbi:hypothetical protein Peur_038224 [Populus x canadensis]
MEGEVEELGMDQRRQRTGRGGRGIGVRRVRKKTRRSEDIPTVEKGLLDAMYKRVYVSAKLT